jgi:hypothetical protein
VTEYLGTLDLPEPVNPQGALVAYHSACSNILRTSSDLIATGNIGCITQIASGTSIPVLHTVELLDFAYGGPKPEGLDPSVFR